MLSRNGDTNLHGLHGDPAQQAQTKRPESLEHNEAPQRHDRQEGGEGLLQAEKAISSPLHPGVRAEAEQGKRLWKMQPSKWLLLPPLCRKQGKVQKNKPVLISNQKLQVEKEGKPLLSLQIIAAPTTPKSWTDLFSWGKV